MGISELTKELDDNIEDIKNCKETINDAILREFWKGMVNYDGLNPIEYILKTSEDPEKMNTALRLTLAAIPQSEFRTVSSPYRSLWIRLGNIYVEVVASVERIAMKVKGYKNAGLEVNRGLTFVPEFLTACCEYLKQANILSKRFVEYFEECQDYLEIDDEPGDVELTSRSEIDDFVKRMERQKDAAAHYMSLLTTKRSDLKPSTDGDKAIFNTRKTFFELSSSLDFDFSRFTKGKEVIIK